MAAWWKTSVIYALFPYSFMDGNGDGIGDLPGILRRLDYLEWLGVDAVWLGPVFRSPMVDVGYDIADFFAIDPQFGAMEDFDAILNELHRRGMKLILDFVPNHTSDKHPWFVESRSSRSNPKRDWYIWRDGRRDGSLPTNWVDNTGQPAWTRDEGTGQYYYHYFLPSQPDLNFRNPEVVAAIEQVMRFWLDKGVDGLRLDAAMHLVEDDLLRDEPMGDDLAAGPPGWMDHLFTADRPETHRVIARLRRVLDAYPDRLFVGEVPAPLLRTLAYHGRDEPAFHLPFNNQLMKTSPWEARRIDAAIDQYMIHLPHEGWPSWVLGSHDVSRVASRVGEAQARVAAMLLLTLPGTIFLYYGDELGFADLELAPDEVVDPYDKYGSGRDPYRAPMAWDSGHSAGFSPARPWLPLPPDAGIRNLSSLRDDPRSILNLHRALIALRKQEPALPTADYRPLGGEGDMLGFRRPSVQGYLDVWLNLGTKPQRVVLKQRGRIILSTGLDRNNEQVDDELELGPDEGVVVRIR